MAGEVVIEKIYNEAIDRAAGEAISQAWFVFYEQLAVAGSDVEKDGTFDRFMEALSNIELAHTMARGKDLKES